MQSIIGMSASNRRPRLWDRTAGVFTRITAYPQTTLSSSTLGRILRADAGRRSDDLYDVAERHVQRHRPIRIRPWAYRFFSLQFLYPTVIGPPTCTCTPINPSIVRPAISSSIATLIKCPFTMCINKLP